MLTESALETMLELGDDNELILRRPTYMAQENSSQQVLSDVEMEDANEITPRPRKFLPNPEDLEVEPYETPVVLRNVKRRQKQVADLSDAETEPSNTLQIDGDEEEGRKGNGRSISATKV